MDELKLPAEVKSLDEYEQCIFKIKKWFNNNHIPLMNLGVEYKTVRELINAEFFFFIVTLEQITNSQKSNDKGKNNTNETEFNIVRHILYRNMNPKHEKEHKVNKIIFKSIIDSLQKRIEQLDKQLETLDNCCDKK